MLQSRRHASPGRRRDPDASRDTGLNDQWQKVPRDPLEGVKPQPLVALGGIRLPSVAQARQLGYVLCGALQWAGLEWAGL